MIRKAAVLTIAALFFASAAFAAPDKGKKKSKSTDVMTCPMTGETATKAGGTTKYGKYVVHYCCPSCKAPFEKLSKADKDKKIAAAMKKKSATTPAVDTNVRLVDVMTCPVTGEKVIGEGGGSVVVGKYNVHFCCAGCKAPFEKLTASEKDEKIQAAMKKG